MTEEPERKTAKVVVLGDIGRSPRMQYHALSLANNGLKVHIIAYVESAPLTEILENPNITISKIHPLVFVRGPKLVRYAAKALWQMTSLLITLCITGNCDYLLCQNPPAIPTLPVCRFYCLLTRTKFIIDWHNYAFTIMSMSLPQDHFILRVSRWMERYFGQSSHQNLCVTYAMKEDLLQNWDIVSTVLYDRPPKIFHPISIQEKHNWFLKISQQYSEFGHKGREQLNQPLGEEQTAFTQVQGGAVEYRGNRPGLLFSSTSWTEDEDFSILMEALQGPKVNVYQLSSKAIKPFRHDEWTNTQIFAFIILSSKIVRQFPVYETTYNLTNRLPKLICVITGKGPMKQHYTELVGHKQWQNVRVVTPWLEAADYPTMVASADLGVCLHTSSSGLDLPMKVVDMFGAGLPVCAFDFLCLDELVENGVNGYTFKSSEELSKQIVCWFEDFPLNEKQNKITEKMKRELTKFQESRWEDNWNLRARKLFES